MDRGSSESTVLVVLYFIWIVVYSISFIIRASETLKRKDLLICWFQTMVSFYRYWQRALTEDQRHSIDSCIVLSLPKLQVSEPWPSKYRRTARSLERGPHDTMPDVFLYVGTWICELTRFLCESLTGSEDGQGTAAGPWGGRMVWVLAGCGLWLVLLWHLRGEAEVAGDLVFKEALGRPKRIRERKGCQDQTMDKL